MKVKEFIENFIEPNTLIRLQYRVQGGYKEVIEGDSPMMEHRMVKSEYADKTVIGITDILCLGSPYVEAVNLVIEKD